MGRRKQAQEVELHERSKVSFQMADTPETYYGPKLPGFPASFSLIGFSFALNLGANSKATGSIISFSPLLDEHKIVELYLMTKYINLFLMKQLGWYSDDTLLLVLLWSILHVLGLN